MTFSAKIGTILGLIVICGLMISAALVCQPALASDEGLILGVWHTESPRKGNPKVGSRLDRLRSAWASGKAAGFDQRRKMGLVDNNVRVIIECMPGQADAVIRAANRLGTVETSYEDLVQAVVSMAQIETLSGHADVKMVRLPVKPKLLQGGGSTISQGVALINADAWHDDNYTGGGLKVGILDAGFVFYDMVDTNLPDPGSIETWWAPSIGDEGDSDHGTQCAEIVYDIAYDAQFYLANCKTEVEFCNAVDWLISKQVNVISCSIGSALYGPGDGSGTICAKVEEARDAGILWAQAAGNEAQQHWSGTYQDTDSDGWHDFMITPRDEWNTIHLNAQDEVTVSLKWDDPWGASDNDYDLYLYDAGGTIVDSSQNWQNGDDNPTESLDFTAAASGDYGIAIYRYSASRNVFFHLYISGDYNLEYQVASGSLLVPADSQHALTVGAVPVSTPDILEFFSSRGPTDDVRIKPDLVAPVEVQTSLGELSGTSAATPHVAGAALLVKQRFPIYTPDQIQAYLEDHAVELGDAGKDNLFGSGRLRLPVESPSLITYSAEDVGEDTARLRGRIDDLGGEADCDYRGFVWDTASHGDPGSANAPGDSAYGNHWTETGSYGIESFDHVISGLSPDTDYYFRACAHNLSGWSYGEELHFLTDETIAPTVTNRTGAQIITDDAVYLWGEITDTGGEDPEVTVYWGEDDGGTSPGNWDHVENLGTKPAGTFHVFVQGLQKDTPYYYRCYAANSAGSDWADSTESFTIITLRPTVTNAGGADPVTASSATLRGELVDSGGVGSAQVNIYWGDDDAGAGGWDHCEYLGTISDGAFSAQIEGLAPSTQYYYRCHAYIPGEGYDWADSAAAFTTNAMIPGVTTQAADPVGETAAGLHGSITDTGGENCDQRGFVWDASSHADPGNSTAPGDSGYGHYWTETGSFGTVSFSHWATQLSPGTDYTFRACVHNSAGWKYGPELSFTTKPGAPTGFDAVAVSTSQINLSWTPGDGALKIMVRWSTTTYPSAPDDGNQAYFGNSGNTSHTGLVPDTHYYYRAWSWVAGSDVWSDSSATADATTQEEPGPTAPTVTTSPATGMTARSTTLHGNLTGLGTASSVQVSFEYKTTSETNWHQTTPASKTSTGTFDFSLNSLVPDTEYLYRARADGDGIGYGNTYGFSTLALAAPTVVNNGASDVTGDGAILHAALSDLGTASTVQVSFEYTTASETTWHQTTPESMTSTGTFDHALGGLEANTTYYFRAKAVGDGTGYSGQQGFTTGTTPPAVTTQTPDNVSSYSARLKGQLDSLGTSALVDVCFEWRQQGDTSYTDTYPRQTVSAAGEFTFHLSGLTGNTPYEYRAKAIGHGTAIGSVEPFTTNNASSFVNVPYDFASIQEAIGASADYATIWVDARGPEYPYAENIVVDKPVTILAPDGPAGTLVSGNETTRDYVFKVTANDVTIDGFTVQYGSSGIYLNGVTGCTISRNVLTDNWNGIELEGSSNNRVEGNELTGGEEGIYLSNSHNNIISGNTLRDAGFGVKLYAANNNRLEGNSITANELYGIYALQSTGTEIIGNHIYNNATSGDPYYGGIGLDSGATGTIIHYNNIYGNSASQEYHYGLFTLDPAVGDVDARYNHWGHASGPRHETASWRPDPGGDKVDANVMFRPWLIAEYDPASPPDIATDIHIVTGSLLPEAIEGEPYLETLQASGGIEPYGWALYSGTLPDGLSLNQTTGEISGRPTAEGKYGFAVQVNDGIQGTYQDFQFETDTNNPPHTPRSPSPSDHATGVPADAALSWTGGDPDLGNTVTYDVYFGTSQPPPLVSNDQATTAYEPGALSYDTYYWQIVATDNYGASTAGPIWDFSRLDINAPDPDPMTWATEPAGTSTSSIAMTATTAMDDSTPIQYFFDFSDSPTGGSGGNDSGWQASTSYTDSGLQANHQYGYCVKAKDGEGNETDCSPTVYAYTWANVPAAAGFTNVTQTSIRANWTANGNPADTEYYCENTTNGTNSGWTKDTYWASTGLACGTSYSFRVRARNGDGTQTSPIALGSQITESCSSNCPDCSGDSRTIENVTFISGTVCECICTTSITIGAAVTVQAGATVTFRAPIVRVRPGFRAEKTSKVYIKQR